jgi:type II secretory pathway component GspD/PulD (secretin)
MTKKRRFMSVRFCTLYLLVFVVLAPNLCHAEAAILRLMYRNASEALPLVQDLLSRQGRAAVDVQSNSLVIVDTPESIRRIEEFLGSLDQPLKQARIRVRFVEAGSAEERSLSVEGGISGRNWRVSRGRSVNGVDILARDKAREHRERSEYYIQAASGHWAYIAVGKDIPFTLQWIDLTRRSGRTLETTMISRIETGFDVRPVVMGDRADVQIVPRISHEVPGREREVIQFASASTYVTVLLGQWTEIGAANIQGNEVMNAILETGSAAGQDSLLMLLMVEAVN